MQLLEYPVLQDWEQIMVDKLALVQVPPLDILLLEGLLEFLYATGINLS